MVTIICRWDTVQMDNKLEWLMWRQIKGAFFPDPSQVEFTFVPINADLAASTFKQFDTLDEALAATLSSTPRVFLEPRGEKTLSEIPSGDIVLVLGNTEQNNMDDALSGETYRISTPGSTDLYGINAAAIALAVRYGQ